MHTGPQIKYTSEKKIQRNTEAGKMAQTVKHLLSEEDNLSSIPQTPGKPGTVVHTCAMDTGKAETGGSVAYWSAESEEKYLIQISDLHTHVHPPNMLETCVDTCIMRSNNKSSRRTQEETCDGG